MNSFIGRERELNTLNNLYHTPGFQMAVIYGRRRVGKSTLITEFLKAKRAIYYVATKVSTEKNRSLFAHEALQELDPDNGNISFPSLEDLLLFIDSRLPEEKIILVIDELPYWAENDESILSVFQKVIDTRWNQKNLFLILCGSSLSFMQGKVLSEKSPLFGRRTAQIHLEAFPYADAAAFVPNYTPEEQAICYGITGGIAKYLSLLDDSLSLDENIISLFFDSAGYLYEEPRNLLSQEFHDVTAMNNILGQVASGENTLNLISGKLNEKEPVVLYSLNKLLATGLVGKRICITEENNRKKSQYILKDHMFRFWYSYIPKAEAAIALGRGDVYYERIVKPDLHNFMGPVFEEMCRFFTLSEGLSGNLNEFISQVGVWWGNEIITENGSKKSIPFDIDVVGLSPQTHKMVIGECKFKTVKTDKSVYDTLVRRGNALSKKYEICQYLLFSLSGFTDWYKDNTSRNYVRLYTLEDLLGNAD